METSSEVFISERSFFLFHFISKHFSFIQEQEGRLQVSSACKALTILEGVVVATSIF